MKGGFDFTGILPLVLIFVVMYFLIIRPQSKKAKQHRELVAGLGKGARVVMNGGLIGVVKEVLDQEMVLQVSKDVEVHVARSMVSGVMDSSSSKKTGLKEEPKALSAAHKSASKTKTLGKAKAALGKSKK